MKVELSKNIYHLILVESDTILVKNENIFSKISEINNNEKIIFSNVFINNDINVNGNQLLLIVTENGKIIKFLYDENENDEIEEVIILETKKNLLLNLKLVKVYFETLKHIKNNITNFFGYNPDEPPVFVWSENTDELVLEFINNLP